MTPVASREALLQRRLGEACGRYRDWDTAFEALAAALAVTRMLSRAWAQKLDILTEEDDVMRPPRAEPAPERASIEVRTTRKQLEAIRAIESLHRSSGAWPTTYEIAERLGVSPLSVAGRLSGRGQRLVGHVHFEDGRWRIAEGRHFVLDTENAPRARSTLREVQRAKRERAESAPLGDPSTPSAPDAVYHVNGARRTGWQLVVGQLKRHHRRIKALERAAKERERPDALEALLKAYDLDALRAELVRYVVRGELEHAQVCLNRLKQGARS